MTADREVLKAAVLKAVAPYMVLVPPWPQERLADVIVDAVMAVAAEGVTVEWGVRYADDDVVVAIWDDDHEKPEQIARRRHNGTTRIAVRRRVSDWEAVA